MYFKPYRYVKAPIKWPEPPPSTEGNRDTFGEVLSLGLVFLGSLILSTQLIIPFLSFPSGGPLLRPTDIVLGGGSVLGEASNAAVAAVPPEARKEESIPPFFFLSIPKLGIDHARVKTDTRDPDPRDFLGHFSGSALPGDPGVVFIYGHSTFPWLYDPRDYLTIFSTLPRLEKGDQIEINYEEQSWTYIVDGFKTLGPGEIDLTSFGGGIPRLVLMTCVPPGTRLKRFLVLAHLK